MNYWLHRITGGDNALPYAHALLFNEGYLSIGWSDFSDDDFVKAVKSHKGWSYLEDRMQAEGWGLPRNRYNLWRFINEMQMGDVVVIPMPYEFHVFKICDNTIYSNESIDKTIYHDWNGNYAKMQSGSMITPDNQYIDLGFYRKVEPIVLHISRYDYADQYLSSRMKIRQTNANISDIKSSINEAIDTFKNKKPLRLKEHFIEDCVPQLLEHINNLTNADKFEELVGWYLLSIGAKVETPSKNESPTEMGDADKIGYFENIKTAIMVQVKKHEGQTDDWAVQQIRAYKSNHQYGDYFTQMWVISSCDKFSEKAVLEAESANVRLIDGKEFCKMILEIGFSGLSF